MRPEWENEAAYQNNVRRLRNMKTVTILKGCAIILMFIIAAVTMALFAAMLPQIMG